MATAPPPPPTLPPSVGIQFKKNSPPPQPEHAAIPYNDIPPVQETSPSSDHDAQSAAAPSPRSVQNGLQSSLSQGGEDNLSDCDEKYHPVQETDPAPQALNGPQASTVQHPAVAGVQDE